MEARAACADDPGADIPVRPAVTHVLALAERPGRVVWAGAERHLRILLPALRRQGVEVEAIVLATDPGPLVEEGLAEWRAAGVAVRVLARRSYGGRLANLPAFLLQHVRLWAALLRRRDRIIHLHLDLVFAPCAALLARCRYRVLSLHNEGPEPPGRVRRVLAAVWLRFLATRLRRLIAISERVATRFRTGFGCPAEKLDLVEYGLEAPPPRPRARAERGWPEDAFLVGFVGRLAPEKNVFALLEAAALCPELEFVLVGGGPLRADVDRFVAEHHLLNVRLEGVIEDASAWIPLLDVLCLPSRSEGLGLVLVEAMLQGVPVVGSRAGAIPDVLGDGRYGALFDPGDPADLARVLREAAERPAELRARARRARRYARLRFSVDRMGRRTAQVYEHVVQAGKDVPRPAPAAGPSSCAAPSP